ncbi:hypothetical protein DPMN_172616 [Dreissena polymorpha]|uniref:Uncharacterized protein n=1 Tax=Dreissena polymorpha TaxID=45954 RepID=A0A9D4E3Z4_DREPO|nr:hypothetical protein DPMN_172616 [Dreissena polymorpha]
MDWVKQAVAGLNKTLWRRFQADVQPRSVATLTCRSSSNNSFSLDITFPQTRIVIPVPYNGSLIPRSGHHKSLIQRSCGDLRNVLGCNCSSLISKTSRRESIPLVDRHKRDQVWCLQALAHC